MGPSGLEYKKLLKREDIILTATSVVATLAIFFIGELYQSNMVIIFGIVSVSNIIARSKWATRREWDE